MRRDAVWLPIAVVAMTSCTSVNHGIPGDVITMCGQTVALGAAYVDLTATSQPSSGHTSDIEGHGTVVRVSGDCHTGGTVAVSPSTAATVTPFVVAKDGRPEAVRVTLHPNDHTVVVAVVNSQGSRETVTLGDGTASPSSSK
jgi:hypothetical protein